MHLRTKPGMAPAFSAALAFAGESRTKEKAQDIAKLVTESVQSGGRHVAAEAMHDAEYTFSRPWRDPFIFEDSSDTANVRYQKRPPFLSAVGADWSRS